MFELKWAKNKESDDKQVRFLGESPWCREAPKRLVERQSWAPRARDSSSASVIDFISLASFYTSRFSRFSAFFKERY